MDKCFQRCGVDGGSEDMSSYRREQPSWETVSEDENVRMGKGMVRAWIFVSH